MSLENICFVFTYNLPLWRSIETCNRCNIVFSHKFLTYTNQTFCTMSCNRKLIKFFWGNTSKLRSHVLIFAWSSRRFLSSRHASAQAAHGQFTLRSNLKTSLAAQPYVKFVNFYGEYEQKRGRGAGELYSLFIFSLQLSSS